MKIKSSPNSDFTLGIVAITITLFASLLFVSAWSAFQSEQTYKIDNVKHVEGLNDIDNIEEIETYKLSEIELTHEQKQQIMEQKDVTTKNEIHEDASLYSSQQVALTTDNGVYIADVKFIYQNLPWAGLIMTLASLILFFYSCDVCYNRIDGEIPSTISAIGLVDCLCNLNFLGLLCSSIFFVVSSLVVFTIPLLLDIFNKII